MEKSSTTTAADPDRAIIQYFEEGGANPMKGDIEIVNMSDDRRNATFAIKNEDHTLGNALRALIMENTDVDFCGYSIPHPSEAKIHLRIQSRGPVAVEILRKGLVDLSELFDLMLKKFDEAVEAKDYVYEPEVSI